MRLGIMARRSSLPQPDPQADKEVTAINAATDPNWASLVSVERRVDRCQLTLVFFQFGQIAHNILHFPQLYITVCLHHCSTTEVW